MLAHDNARHDTSDPDVWRAHSLSLDALTASDKAEANDEFHDLAAKLHGEAAEAWEMLDDEEHAARHRRAADFHATKARSAGNSVLAGNAVNWVA